MHRQWIGLSLAGEQASVEPMPAPPHIAAPSFLQSIDIEVGFLKRGFELDQQFDADEMSRNFIKAFSGILMSTDEIMVFEFRGYNLKAVVKGLSVYDLADEQRKGMAAGQALPAYHYQMGILMEKTDITFLKAADSAIKLKSSAKKSEPFLPSFA